MNAQPKLDDLPEPVRAFRDRVEAYLANTGMLPTRFGEVTMKDPNFVVDLRAGREPRHSTIERVDRFMREHADGEERDGDDGKALRLAG